MLRLYALLASLALAGAAYGLGRAQGYQRGAAAVEAAYAAERAKTQLKLFDAAERMSRQAAAIEADRAAQEKLAQELEDASRADPDGDRPGIGPDGMQRLERRWHRAP